jgi:hypothetical protein
VRAEPKVGQQDGLIVIQEHVLGSPEGGIKSESACSSRLARRKYLGLEVAVRDAV